MSEEDESQLREKVLQAVHRVPGVPLEICLRFSRNIKSPLALIRQCVNKLVQEGLLVSTAPRKVYAKPTLTVHACVLHQLSSPTMLTTYERGLLEHLKKMEWLFVRYQ